MASLLASAAAGAFVIGRPRRGLALIAGELALVAVGIAAILAQARYGLVPLVFGTIGLRVVGAVVAARSAPGERVPRAGVAWGIAVGLWALAFGDAVAVRVLAVEPFQAPSSSMVPTLPYGSHFFADKRARPIERGDVVVFTYPVEPDKKFVKRVLAVGGDRVEVRDDAFFVNGRPIARRRVEGSCTYEEPDLVGGRVEQRACVAYEEELGERRWRVIQDEGRAPRSMEPRTVPADHVFVVGDNRDNSHDSRAFGPVATSAVTGRAVVRFASWLGVLEPIR
jgi:signal peptidase I